MHGLIADIIPFSVNDGPGIRTGIFFKGCPLRCRWCHNPEAQEKRPQVMVRFDRCVRCGACAVCPEGARGAHGEYDHSRCTGCGLCVSVCPAEACSMKGRIMTTEEVLSAVMPDKPFYRQHGGVTLSGGEPLFQPQFALEVASLMHRNGIGVVVETCAFVPWEDLACMLPFVSRFLVDWKITDPEQHRLWTGTDNLLIRENLKKLHDSGAQIVLRCPVIPGVNDTPDHFHGIAGLTKELPHILRVDLLPYHAMGNDKRVRLGMQRDGFSVPDREMVSRWHTELQTLCEVPVCL